jgi:hypothetical protein
MPKTKTPLEVMRQKVSTARNILVAGQRRPLRDRDIDNVINHLKQLVWAWDTYQGNAKRAHIVIVRVAEALIELHFAHEAGRGGSFDRYERLGTATGLIDDAYEALHRRK